MTTNADILAVLESLRALVEERLPDPSLFAEEIAVTSIGGPLGTALDAILPAFDPPPMSEDEAQAIAEAVVLCAAFNSDPVVLPFDRHLDGLMYALNRAMDERRIPVRAYMRHEGKATIEEDGLKREVKVPAAVMVRRVEFGGRKR